jgi:geranylgeranyl reductase family protein
MTAKQVEDVLIIGAGPAGNNAALELARRGYRVTLADRRYAIGDKLCTGIVGAECLRQFPIDEAHVYRAASGATVQAPGGQHLRIAREAPQAYIVDRVSYVASYAKQAQDAGATYFLGHTVHSLNVGRDSVTAIVQNGAGPKEIHARSAVIASGFGSRLTKSLGLGQVQDYAGGIQATVSTTGVHEVQVYLGKRFAPGFFGWLVPTTEGKALLGLMARKQNNEYFAELLTHLKDKGTVQEIVSGPSRWAIPLRPLKQAYRERVVVVGDAAGQVKPTTGGGIYYSFLSSRIASEALHNALRRDDLSEDALSEYEREWKSLLGSELESGYAARRIFELLGDRQIDLVIDALSSNGFVEKLLHSEGLGFDWHSGVIKEFMHWPVLQGVLRSIGGIGPKALSRIA